MNSSLRCLWNLGDVEWLLHVLVLLVEVGRLMLLKCSKVRSIASKLGQLLATNDVRLAVQDNRCVDLASLMAQFLRRLAVLWQRRSLVGLGRETPHVLAYGLEEASWQFFVAGA